MLIKFVSLSKTNGKTEINTRRKAFSRNGKFKNKQICLLIDKFFDEFHLTDNVVPATENNINFEKRNKLTTFLM